MGDGVNNGADDGNEDKEEGESCSWRFVVLVVHGVGLFVCGGAEAV